MRSPKPPTEAAFSFTPSADGSSCLLDRVIDPCPLRAGFFIRGSASRVHNVMPFKPNKPCAERGCNVLTRDSSGRCEQHQRAAWAKKEEAPRRITGRRLQKMRATLFKQEPLCRVCASLGLAVVAVERDHVVCLAEGGADDPSNTQPLCEEHHAEKSKAEALRGMKRWR
jgi:5-methylcytosine-specific restriction protein A